MTELLQTGELETIKPVEETTIKDMITALGISAENCGILVNGKSTGLDTIVTQDDEVVIIPHLAGG